MARYLAYVASFSTIGAVWLGHNAITEYLERADAAFVRLNLLLLLVISFLPFPTRLFADYIGQDSSERVAVTIYGVVLLATSTCCWSYGATRSGSGWCGPVRPIPIGGSTRKPLPISHFHPPPWRRCPGHAALATQMPPNRPPPVLATAPAYTHGYRSRLKGRAVTVGFPHRASAAAVPGAQA